MQSCNIDINDLYKYSVGSFKLAFDFTKITQEELVKMIMKRHKVWHLDYDINSSKCTAPLRIVLV